jgi:hypothetical protein
MKHLIALTAFVASTIAATSFAVADDIRLGTPGYGGNGCPAGSASTVLSPDQKSLSILFDSYLVEAGGTTGKSLDRKSCNIAIPVHVPQGLSISVLAIDYRGFNAIPSGAKTTFNVEYFFAGAQGPSFTKVFSGPINGNDYTIHNDLQANAIVWSACGADVNLRTNSSIRVQTTANKDAQASVDSEDVNAAIVYQLQWKQC